MGLCNFIKIFINWNPYLPLALSEIIVTYKPSVFLLIVYIPLAPSLRYRAYRVFLKLYRNSRCSFKPRRWWRTTSGERSFLQRLQQECAAYKGERVTDWSEIWNCIHTDCWSGRTRITTFSWKLLIRPNWFLVSFIVQLGDTIQVIMSCQELPLLSWSVKKKGGNINLRDKMTARKKSAFLQDGDFNFWSTRHDNVFDELL